MIVDDGRGGLDRVIPLLAGAGLQVVHAPSAQAASGLLAQTRPDVLIVEQAVLTPHSPELQELRGRDNRIAIIMQCDPLGTQQRRELIRQLNLDGIHERGTDPKGLLALIESARARAQRVQGPCPSDELRALVVVKLCHDLRSSLHVIRGYAEILAEGSDAPSPEIADRLLAVSDAALALTQDCLDLTGADTPSAGPPTVSVDLDSLLGEVHASAAHQITGRPLRFTVAVPFACACMRVDGEKLRAVVSNLVADAIHFSRCGEIQLLVRGEAGYTEFILTDCRPREDADDLSCRLRTLESGAEIPVGGESNIRLAIACQMSRVMGGTLTVTPGRDEGATVVLRLPGRVYRKQKVPAATVH